MTDTIAGTVYRRLYATEHDLLIAIVEHPVLGESLWCVGCVLTPTWEQIFSPTEMAGHMRAHQRHLAGEDVPS